MSDGGHDPLDAVAVFTHVTGACTDSATGSAMVPDVVTDVGSGPPALASCLYILLCTTSNRATRNRPPAELPRLMAAYNAFQVVYNAINAVVLFLGVYRNHLRLWGNPWTCGWAPSPRSPLPCCSTVGLDAYLCTLSQTTGRTPALSLSPSALLCTTPTSTSSYSTPSSLSSARKLSSSATSICITTCAALLHNPHGAKSENSRLHSSPYPPSQLLILWSWLFVCRMPCCADAYFGATANSAVHVLMYEHLSCSSTDPFSPPVLVSPHVISCHTV